MHGYRRTAKVDAQVKQLRAAGAEKVWRETASGAKTDRAQLRRALAIMIPRATRINRSEEWPDA
jgi:hypothetical protein